MSHMFAAPPPDIEYNQHVENDPEFPRACKFTQLVSGLGGASLFLPILKYFLDNTSPTALLFHVLVALAIAVVPASILLVYFFRGLVWYNIRTTVPNPSPFFGVFIAGISLTVAGSMNRFVAYGPLFFWALPPAVVIWLAMIFTTDEFKSYTRLDIGNMGAILFTCYVFSFGALISSNCVFDTNAPRVFPTTITEKKITENKDYEKTYRLYFTPVPGLEDNEKEVHASFYRAVEINDTIRFNLKEGIWGHPWYYLEPLK